MLKASHELLGNLRGNKKKIRNRAVLNNVILLFYGEIKKYIQSNKLQIKNPVQLFELKN